MATHTVQRAVFEQAGTFLGLAEYPGAKDNSIIVNFAHTIGHDWVDDDETPWCASFVGSVLASLGLPHTGKLNARSYEHWGQEVKLQDAVPGDIVVLWRNSPASWEGHVGFFAGIRGDAVLVRGGNQGNAVTDQGYPLSRLLTVRRLDLDAVDSNRPTLREGNSVRLTSVEELQIALQDLGFFAGEIDGLFGRHTKEAVLAFQAHAGLATDGVVGPKTWNALVAAKPAPLRVVSEDVLRDRGSRTILDADIAEDSAKKTRRYTLGASGTAVVAYFGENLDDLGSKLDQANGVFAKLGAMLMLYWPLFIIAGLAAAAIYHQHLIEAAQRAIRKWRTQDAQTGKHMGR